MANKKSRKSASKFWIRRY